MKDTTKFLGRKYVGCLGGRRGGGGKLDFDARIGGEGVQGKQQLRTTSPTSLNQQGGCIQMNASGEVLTAM